MPVVSPEIQFSDLTVQFDITPHYAFPSFQKGISLDVFHPEHGKIAYLTAVHINRNAACLGGRFYQLMDEDVDELATFSRALFDKHGFLKRHLIDNSHLRGTGTWGRELDSGGLIYITILKVEAEFCHLGIGSWTIKQLLASPHVGNEDFSMCWPAPLNNRELTNQMKVTGLASSGELWSQILGRLVNFFRKNGFRRVGRTQFFAFSQDTTHPSRSVPQEEDASAIVSGWLARGSSVDVEMRHARYPLHCGIHDLEDEQIVQKIQAAYNADPDSIHQRDDNGYTPIFAAAATPNLNALKKLIVLGVSDDLTNRDNPDGLTPLEAFTKQMASAREFSETLLERWAGFSKEELVCVAMMKRAISPSRMTITNEEYAALRKWGCTCGKCLDGWLSPRMKLRLEYEGEMNFDMMNDLEDFVGFVNREPLPADSFNFALGADYIPLHLRDQVYKSFYKGYQCAFEAVTYISRKNIIPYPLAVRQAMLMGGFRGHDYFSSRAIEFFFSKGGKPDFALDCILDTAEQQSPLGDYEFDSLFEDHLEKLPECANDLEFDLVRQNLGLRKDERGPF